MAIFVASMRIVGYARVSTREQSENSHALEQQVARLKAAGCQEIYVDVESGRRDDRADFNRMMTQVRERAVTEIVVTRLDRLTRSLPTLRQAIDTMQAHDTNLRSLDDAIDLSTASGKFHLNMLGSLAEMETDRLAERVRHGWKHLRSRRVAMNPPFGYRKVSDRHQLDVSPFLCLLEGKKELSRAAIAREIVETFLQRRTLRLTLRAINERYGIQIFAHNQKAGGRVAQGLFRFSPSGLRDWLLNPVLQGHLCYLRGRSDKRPAEIYLHTHPEHRIVSGEEAREIEAILAHNARVRGYGSTALKYPLSGLVFCGECRSACYSLKGSRGRNQPGWNFYYQCKNWRMRACGSKQVIRMELAEAAVVAALIQRASAITEIALQPEEIVESPQLRQLRTQLRGLEDLGHNPAFENAKAEIRGQIAQMEYQTRTSVQVDEGDRELLVATFSDALYWETLPESEQREILHRLVKRVMVRSGQVENVLLKV